MGVGGQREAPHTGSLPAVNDYSQNPCSHGLPADVLGFLKILAQTKYQNLDKQGNITQRNTHPTCANILELQKTLGFMDLIQDENHTTPFSYITAEAADGKCVC